MAMVRTQWPVLWTVSILLCAAVFALLITQALIPSPSPIAFSAESYSSAGFTFPNISSKHGSEFISQFPSENPQAILFLAHGCGCRPAFFWDKSPSCPHCIGLPEERIYVSKALQLRYAVIAIASTNPCWNDDTDCPKVLSILTDWIRDNQLQDLPVFALGASSGGFFVSTLALKFRFKALALIISEGHFRTMKLQSDYPPTLFVHMPKDEERMAGVRRSMKILRERGIITSQIECPPLAVTPEFLSDRIQGFDRRLSRRIFWALKNKGIVDEDGFMQQDGRDAVFAVAWNKLLPPDEGGGSDLKWSHHVREELNLAFAYHEMTSLPANNIFNWFQRFKTYAQK